MARAEAQRWIDLMEARGDSFRHQGELAAFRAAPRLYVHREVMKVLAESMAEQRKFVLVGIDPERVKVNIVLEETPPLFSFGAADTQESDQ